LALYKFVRMHICTIKIGDVTHLHIQWRAFPASGPAAVGASTRQQQRAETTSQPASCEPLSAVSDNCLGTQHPALWPRRCADTNWLQIQHSTDV